MNKDYWNHFFYFMWKIQDFSFQNFMKKDDLLKTYAGLRLPTLPYRQKSSKVVWEAGKNTKKKKSFQKLFIHPQWKWNKYATYTTFGNENIFRRYLNICQVCVIYVRYILANIYVQYMWNIFWIYNFWKKYILYTLTYILHIYCFHPTKFPETLIWYDRLNVVCDFLFSSVVNNNFNSGQQVAAAAARLSPHSPAALMSFSHPQPLSPRVSQVSLLWNAES